MATVAALAPYTAHDAYESLPNEVDELATKIAREILIYADGNYVSDLAVVEIENAAGLPCLIEGHKGDSDWRAWLQRAEATAKGWRVSYHVERIG